MMMGLFRKLGFVDDKEFTVNIGKDQFVRKFKTEVREGSSSTFFMNPFEAFKSYEESYIGTVNHSKFEIRNLLGFGTSYQSMSKIKGTITGNEEKTMIKATFLTGKRFLPILIFLPFFYLFAISGSIISSISGEGSGAIAVIPFLLLHGVFMCGIFWLIMKRSHKGIKKRFEKDLVYIAHK